MGLKKIFALCIALGIMVVFVGCKQPTEPEVVYQTETVYSYIYPVQADSKIVGTWVSDYGENFKISPTSFENSGSWGITYAGSNTYVRYTSTSKDSGYIYFKYTKAYKSLDAAPWYEYSTDAPDVGKWYCVSFKNLTENSVSLSGAYKTDGKTSTETLEEAVTEFTIDNEYFAVHSECTK